MKFPLLPVVIGCGMVLMLALILTPNQTEGLKELPAFSKVLTGGDTITARQYNSIMNMRYPYAQLSDSTTQACAAAGAASNILLNTNDSVYHITHSTSSNTHLITIQESGIYQIITAPQVGEATVQASGVHNFWMLKNSVAVANSNIKTSVMQQVSGSETMVGVLNWVGRLESGDSISFAQSCTDADIGLIFTASTAVEPATPSVIVSIARIN